MDSVEQVMKGLTKADVIAFEDFLNEPPRRYDVEPMEVRDFRHEAYRKWEPICRALIAGLELRARLLSSGGEG